MFNNNLGFDCIDAGLDLPLRARFSIKGPKYLRMKELYSAFSHSYFVGKKIKDIDFDTYTWIKANPTLLDEKIKYPERIDNLEKRHID